jgi:phosphoribosylformylglycinamidine synthase
MIHTFKGVSAISDFKAKQLLGRLQKLDTRIKGVCAEYIHFVELDENISEEQKKTLAGLLAYDEPFIGKANGQLFLVAPRPGTISPWSSKATSIAENSGLPINRVERTTAYYIDSAGPLDKERIKPFLHDRMTEIVFEATSSADALFSEHEAKPLLSIDILGGGLDVLKKADKEMGLALSEAEIEYLYESYKKINRNPTDLELMMFGVVNSEHCRHKIFNADWFIDGKKQPKSLFKMIKNTYDNHSDGIISAYSDNSAILNGHKAKQLEINPISQEYEEKTVQSHLVAKVETHNHPTAIAPFPGAATGSGGEIRDENATGRGARAKMGLTGFSVSNLRIPGFVQPWEGEAGSPERISSPLEIMIKGPLGGASFNNEFGRPNTAGYFRVYENGPWGYHKPIMIAGGVGAIKDGNTAKNTIPAGAKLVVLGGPSMLIGLAGGAASSMESGKSDAELDFASVQRGNAEMQRRAFEVINRCASMEEENPIISVHDVGAGGLSNALTELVNDSGLGAIFELRDVDCAEPGMSPMEIWCNEAQERYVLALDKKDLELFNDICQRERCPYSVVGETTKERQLVINDSLLKNQPANIPMQLLFGGPPKITKEVNSRKKETEAFDTTGIELKEAIDRVLRVPSVGSKKFLITIGDRNVGGLTVRDQMIGPWQVPVSDCAVSATSFYSQTGEAMAMGEKTPLATIDAPASGRMAIAEAITNIAAAKINKLSDIKLSANWMAASGHEAEDYNLFETVKAVGEEFCPALDLTIPVGKDSLSMRTVWKEGNDDRSVTSPVSLIISAFSPVSDINKTLTPQLVPEMDSTLIFIDLGKEKARMGGSALAQAYKSLSGEVPDAEDPQMIKQFFDCIQELNASNLISSYHDRSDGGLLTVLLEMAFAGRTGIKIDITDIPGSTDIEKLFNEELGAVIQVSNSALGQAEKILKKYVGEAFFYIGTPADNQKVTINSRSGTVLDEQTHSLEAKWAETSYRIQAIRDNAKCAEQEFELIGKNDRGINPKLTFKNISSTYDDKRPKVAILREEGVNGQTEMAAAFNMAGFTAVDVHMKDLLDKKVSLGDFTGMALCGGFSYGDVLGAGQGWAKSILSNAYLKSMFKDFFARPDTFSLGVCNGCQALSALKEIIPGADHWPQFLKNTSEQFEARLVSVKINESPSVFFKGMEGSVVPIPVAHGEGRAAFKTRQGFAEALSKNLAPLQYVDNDHKVTEAYPLNPNGSQKGIASLCSDDGRALIMMPHPERAFLSYQHSWHPADWPKEAPWLRMFQNARAWVDNK